MSQTTVFENERWEKGLQNEEYRHRQAIGMISGASVLDLGCGDGLFLSLVSNPAIKKFGIDISPVAISHLKQRGLDGKAYDFAENDLPFPDQSFDSVTALDVLEHLYFPERVLREALRVSKECVIIGVPNFSSLPARLSVLIGKVPENNRPKKGHCFWFNLDVLRRIVDESGGEITLLCANTFWESRPVLAPFMRVLVKWFPALFALSFVVMIRKESE